jgi:octaprenyl-diphosphate synthase
MRELKLKILARVKDDLKAIEGELARNLRPHLDLVSEVAGHILFSGGKRLRPLLMVQSARLCGYEKDDDKKFSTIFEYLHAATLLHDDLVDGAPTRRGRPAAHAIWGNSTAVLVGDFLLARSLTIAADTGRPDLIRVIAEITENMSQGEIDQLAKKGRLDISEKEYMEVIRRKTSVLIQGACLSGAMIADASHETQEALSNYGFHVGVAFQMADDLLDYTADPQVLGKAVGADLKEGKLTLPVIYALQKASRVDRKRMEKIIVNDDFTGIEFEMLLGLLKQHGGISYTRRKAAAHILQAKEALSMFEPSETKEVLLNVADYALARER